MYVCSAHAKIYNVEAPIILQYIQGTASQGHMMAITKVARTTKDTRKRSNAWC